MPRAILIRGASVVGKTTIAKKLVENLGDEWIHIELENFFLPYFKKLKPGVKELAFRNSSDVAGNFIRAGYSLIIEGRLFFEVRYMERFKSFLKELGVDFYSFELLSPLEVLIERNRGRELRKTDEKLVAFYDLYEPSPGDDIVKIQNEDPEKTLDIIHKML